MLLFLCAFTGSWFFAMLPSSSRPKKEVLDEVPEFKHVGRYLARACIRLHEQISLHDLTGTIQTQVECSISTCVAVIALDIWRGNSCSIVQGRHCGEGIHCSIPISIYLDLQYG